ncbi:ribosome-releasing factor 2, mitochondrial isoform X2 [Halyomorpha halys]|uniref:ribosome-releasing factor 2, mitochondrial isoform X2 n=1 Tax=Halyomorpha halys TaxID=286706 RepID=UPI0006D4DF17
MLPRMLLFNAKRKLKSPLLFLNCQMHNTTYDGGLKNIRNIGILAHIDAGKTTTTERMLFYSGRIKNMGEVHRGTTVTDFMEQERNRGITISSAYVSFQWNNHLFNLVDTPGHIDFTAEVEQALNVMDSAVVVLDASEGVEVQTVTVWKQANDKKLPCLVYANKMDRPDSDLILCEKTLKEKLGVIPLVLHIPLKEKSLFRGVVDLVSMKKIVWCDKEISVSDINDKDDHYASVLEKRNHLIDQLSTLDNDLADVILQSGCFESVSREELLLSIRKVTVSKKGVPLICGSSYKNIGIETLLDAVIQYLPSPLEFSGYKIQECFKNDIIGKSFKVMHDKQRGPLVFFRIYSGNLEKGKKVYNLHKEKTDKALSLYKVFADEMNEVSSVGCGNFVAVSGLKTVQSGDIICSSSTAAKKLKIFNCKNKDTFEKLLQGSWVPKPVFFCSVEPPSQFYQLALDKALLELSREDPSLKVTLNNETGQTILGGSKEHNVNISLSLRPERSPEILHLDTSKEASENLAHVSPQTLTTIKYGVISGLSKGPLMSCEVTDSYIVLHNLTMSKRIPDSLLVAATAQCVNKMLKVTGTKLLEPIMEVSIAVEDLYLQSVLGDLTRRRANIINISSKYAIKEIVSEVPLAELRGYAKYLRTITSGSARLTMEFASYREVLPQVQEKIMDGLI